MPAKGNHARDPVAAYHRSRQTAHVGTVTQVSYRARFNPFRDSAGCSIAMRWQRRLKTNSSEDQTLLLEIRTRHGSHFLRASFAGRRISLPSKTEILTSNGRKS